MTQPGKNKTERFLSSKLFLTAVWLFCFHLSGIAQLSSAYEEAPISYSTAETSNHADFLSLAIQAMPDKQLPLLF